uniref:Serine carboxypeptidase n=1 Tax=Haemonchus placei TaxID=6290 RepID=A0A0N4WQT4_HAEPC
LPSRRHQYIFQPVTASCDHYNDSTVYLQREDVRRALNIPSIIPAYESCNRSSFKVALFYGDVDSICNAIHGAQFASELGLNLKSPQSIYTDQQQEPPTIGFITQYEGLDFLTVRGAGHFVASSDEKPKEALQLFVNFLRGTNYSTPIDYLTLTGLSSLEAIAEIAGCTHGLIHMAITGNTFINFGICN